MSRRDGRLDPFLDAADPAGAAGALDALLRDCADPLAAQVIARRLRNPIDRQDAEDLRHDVHVHLVARLHDIRAHPPDEPIADFDAYVATTAHRACDAHLRRRFPNRARLKSRVRYAVTHHPDLTLRDTGIAALCGLRGWPIADDSAGRAALRQLRLPDALAGALAREDPQRVGLPRLLIALLTTVGAAVELDDLVSAAAECLGVTDAPPVVSAREPGTSVLDAMPSDSASPEAQAEARDYLRHLWTEIQSLPPRQRSALLLNLRDDRGGGVIALFALTETANHASIAAALDLTADELARLWADLPIDDARIAERLRLTRQQVINLRKSARLRLARRMRKVAIWT